MKEPNQTLAPQTPYLWRISRSIRFIFFGLPFWCFIGFILYLIFQEGPLEKYAIVIGTLFTTMFSIRSLILALIWPSFEYQYFRWDIREDDLIVQQGVLFRQWVVIPRHRIQHVDTTQGPLERFMGIANLRIYTAAGISADGSIPGLLEEEAEKIRDDLSENTGDDGV
jgi:uncharacterized protein